MASKTVAAAVSAYGSQVKAKLTNPAALGEPEDQLRAPLEALIRDLAEISSLAPGHVGLVGETRIADLKTRPDYAVSIRNALVGFIEVKAPGKGADPRRFKDPHDKDQWNKLKALPNLLYTDGTAFALWQDGELAGKAELDGDIETAGPDLRAPATLEPLISDFLGWNPIPPRTAKALAETTARLCRLMRDQVVEQMKLGSPGLTALAEDWRKLLFPEADDATFADGYAQAVTFGLVVARARNISLENGIRPAAGELRKTNSLIGTALQVLTDDSTTENALNTSLKTLTRVLQGIDWATVTRDRPESWLYFYEDFLEIYDNSRRKRTGSYYTPPEVVTAMVRLVDEALRGPLFDRPAGLASLDVTIADPAVGTGTFLLGVLRRIASIVADDQGAGVVPGAIASATQRVIGFELQFGPFAVAQLRLIAEVQALMKTPRDPTPMIPDLRLYITDTLDNPYSQEESLGAMYAAITKSRHEANEIKKNQPITVVIGNPPYKNAADGRGGWIESGSDGREPPLDRWAPPKSWKVGTHAKHLKNLYVYFWRWATWKVFGSGFSASTGLPEKDREGIVCFITVAGFLNGPGFQKMRDDLRRTCSDIWIIDCSPEGHQPDVQSRFFPGVQQPICIALAARKLGKPHDVPARVRYRALPEGKREQKFEALAKTSFDDPDWVDCPSEWRAPFLPEAVGAWASFPPLKEFFLYDGSGVMPGRTWPIAPDTWSLNARWSRLIQEPDPARKEVLFHPQLRDGQVASRHIRKVVAQDLGIRKTTSTPLLYEAGEAKSAERYAFRSFDRQWLLADARVLNDVRPILWNAHSPRQVYLTAPEDRSPENGPAFTIASAIPDLHHYNGRGGRVHPLWRDQAAKVSNIQPELLEYLAKIYGRPVGPEDMMAYLAAVMAHPAFTARFAKDLVRPGLRVPMTADASLFDEAVRLGREVVWLHCYGERFTDAAAGRPRQAPRLPKGEGPFIPAEGAIPGAPEPLPDTMDYDPGTRRLHIGRGFVENVSPPMWAYEVSGKQVLWHWFSYRRRDRSRPIIGDRRPPSPLDAIQPDHWLPEYTSDLLDLLHVLGRLVALEPAQADLLERICAGPLFTAEQLRLAGALPAPETEPAPAAVGEPESA